MPAASRPAPFTVADLVGSRIVLTDGTRIGHVVDVQVTPAPDWSVISLTYGAYGWLYRFRALRTVVGRLGIHFVRDEVPWESVESFRDFTVHLKPGYDPRSNNIDRA